MLYVKLIGKVLVANVSLYLHCAPVLDSILPDKDVGHSALLEDGVLLANLFGKPSFLLLTGNCRYISPLSQFFISLYIL